MRERAFVVVEGEGAVCVCSARVAAALRVAGQRVSIAHDVDHDEHSRLSREAIADVDGGDREGA